MPVPAGAVEIFTAVAGYAAVIMGAGTAKLFMTPGEGL
jgi:Flp pilus assembly protein protease CpaA